MDFEIVRAGASSLPGIEHLWRELNQHHINIAGCFSPLFRQTTWETRKDDLERKAERGKMIVDMVKLHDEVIGYGISTITEAGVGELDSLCILEKHRQQGIGKILVERSIAWMASEGARSQTINVICGNDGALALYKSLGFVPVRLTLMMPPQEQ